MIKIKCLKPNKSVIDDFVYYAKHKRPLYTLARLTKPDYIGPVLIARYNSGEIVCLANLTSVGECYEFYGIHYYWRFQNLKLVNSEFKIEKRSNVLFDAYLEEQNVDLTRTFVEINLCINFAQYEQAVTMMLSLGNDFSGMHDRDMVVLCGLISKFWYNMEYCNRSLVAKRLFFVIDNILSTHRFAIHSRRREEELIGLRRVINDIYKIRRLK